MISDKYRDSFIEIKKLYDTAEADLKNIGHDQGSLSIAGINQCRYVGQHILRAIAATDDKATKEELDAARRHAQRAIYDINDSGIQYFVSKIDQMRNNDFSTVGFHEIVKNYGDIIEEIKQAKRLTQTTVTSLGTGSNREQFYTESRQHVTKLREYYTLLDEYRPEFIRVLQKDNRDRWRTWAAIALALFSLLGIITTVLIAILIQPAS